MNSHCASSYRKVGTDSHQQQDFKAWFQKYTAEEGDYLHKDSDVIQVVNSDELNVEISLNNEYGYQHQKLPSRKDSVPNVKICSTTGLH